MVIDNADDEDVLFTAPKRPDNLSAMHERKWLIDFLSIPTHGLTYLTTRSDSVASKYIDPDGAIHIGPMENKDAISLSCRRTKQ